MQDELQIRAADERDAAAILRSFNLVFREVCGAGYVDRTLTQWRWLYVDNPAGRRIHVAVTPAGDVAAHYGGLPCHVDSPFGACTFVQGVDSFVVPQWRQGLRKSGVFVSTAEAWFAASHAQYQDAVVYGYPVPAAARVGGRFLGYTDIRVVDYLMLDPAAAPVAPQGIDVQRLEKLGPEVDQLAGALPAEQIRLRRDASYLSWRYLRCPDACYEVWGARRAGRLAGILALRPRHELVPGACTIADWVVPGTEPEVTRALVAAAAARALQAERMALLAVFADWSAENALLRQLGFRAEPSAQWMERRLMHRTFDPGYTTETLATRWWYTLGDSDLV